MPDTDICKEKYIKDGNLYLEYVSEEIFFS